MKKEGKLRIAKYCVLTFFSFLFFNTLFMHDVFSGQAEISYHVPLHSSLEQDIQTLYGLGYLDELFPGFRPYSRLEVAKLLLRLRERLAKFSSEEVGNRNTVFVIIERLERELKEEIELIQSSKLPVDGVKQIQLKGVYIDGTFSGGGLDRVQSIKNFAGRPYENGFNLYGSITFAGRLGNSILLYLDPEFQYTERDIANEDALKQFKLQEGYLKYHTAISDVMFGNVPLWWGQGFNGSLLLTDNIEPLTMIRFYKETPFTFSLPFNQKGSFTYDLFVSRLEEHRELPYPIFWGLRLGFKPLPSWEIGVARTAMFGGGHRPVYLKTALNSITGLGENRPSESGNQIAGYDTNFKGHLWNQPVNVYGELYGEDQAGIWPSKFAYVVGLYMPEVIGLHGNAIRVEYSDDTSFPKKDGTVWYRHHIYTDGYTYNGRIMGHSMGTDADDFFLRWDRYFSVNKNGFISLERNRIGLSKSSHWEVRDYSAGGEFLMDRGKGLGIKYTLQKVDNFGFNPGKDFDNHEFWINLKVHL